MPQVRESLDASQEPSAKEGVLSSSDVEAVADRVYELLRREMRTDRERGGLPAPWSPDR
jgi:hypothetical protein